MAPRGQMACSLSQSTVKAALPKPEPALAWLLWSATTGPSSVTPRGHGPAEGRRQAPGPARRHRPGSGQVRQGRRRPVLRGDRRLVEDGAEVIKGIAQNGLLPPEATQAQVQTMGKRVADTAAVMGEDVGNVSRVVGTMLQSGIAKSADEAMDVLVRGSQNGTNAAEELLDTFSEYPTQFRDLGIDAQTAMGLMQQGLQCGARDADTVADALKEFAIRSKDMSKTSVDAFTSIGLNADTMAATFTKSGRPPPKPSVMFSSGSRPSRTRRNATRPPSPSSAPRPKTFRGRSTSWTGRPP